jgi:DNA-binding HxlR family transcriptional regulator
MGERGVEYSARVDMAGIAKDRRPILYALDIVRQKWKLPICWHLSR